METLSWSAIISGIALMTAIISPVITSIINNNHQIKIKNIEYYSEHRAKVIEDYIRVVGGLSTDAIYEQYLGAYGKCSKEIYLYIPEKLWHYIDDIDTCISNSEPIKAKGLLRDFCIELNKYPPRSIKNKCNHKN